MAFQLFFSHDDWLVAGEYTKSSITKHQKYKFENLPMSVRDTTFGISGTLVDYGGVEKIKHIVHGLTLKYE